MEQYNGLVEEVFNEQGASASIQHVGGESFLHCSVDTLTPSVIKSLRKALSTIIKNREEGGINRPLFSYTQNPKFAKMMGGEYLTSFVEEGKYFEVWMWELKQEQP